MAKKKTLYFADICVAAHALVPIKAYSYEEAEQKAIEMCAEETSYDFCESLRKKLHLCDPEVNDVFEDD